MNEKRRAQRIVLNTPTLIEAVPQPTIKLHDNLAKVYERIEANIERAGEKLPGVLRDLSTNGAFVTGITLPLMSRVAFSFALQGFGQVEVLGWVMWRRTADCEVPTADGQMVPLSKGFGVLFEAIPLDARVAIHELVRQSS
ncbi:MAG TPA: PilZ domain-containing protein [Kofleriaceae bacterium]|nr:PilZ domain-containing protein [Kofleriaceae bacterium]